MTGRHRRMAAVAVALLAVLTAFVPAAAGPATARAATTAAAGAAPVAAAGRVAPAAPVAAGVPLAAGTGSNSGASASEARPGTTAPRAKYLSLVGQSPWVASGQVFSLLLSVGGHPQADTLELVVFPRLVTRTAYGQSLQNTVRGNPEYIQTYPLSPGAAPQMVCVPLGRASPTCTQPVLSLRLPGVYPAQVRLLSGDQVVDRFTTHLLYVDAAPAGSKLELAWVVPFGAGPAVKPSGHRTLTGSQLSSLGQLAAGLADAHQPVTLAPDPDTLAALGVDAAGRPVLDNLKRAVAGAQLTASPYTPLNPYDLAQAGLATELARQLTRGWKVMADTVGRRAPADTWLLNGPVDRSSTAALTGVGMTHLVVPPEDLQSTSSNLTPAAPVNVVVGSGKVSAAITDTGLNAHFAPGQDPVLAAHQMLADLAQIYFEEPGVTRGVVAVSPSGWKVDGPFLSALTDGLSQGPIVEPVTLDGLFATVRTSRTWRYPAAPGRPHQLPAGRIRNDESDLAAFQSALSAPLPAMTIIGDQLLASEGASLTAGQRRSYLSGAESLLSGATRMVRLPTRGGTITLTSRQANVPITVQSTLPVPIHVQLRLHCEQLAFPGMHARNGTVTMDLTLNQLNTTQVIKVSARTSGSFPLDAKVVTAGGDPLVIDSSSITIHSTAVSGVGIIISAVAAAFLLIWWGRNLLAGRRRRNPRLVEP
ncbi:MAG TPA: DUF6049 family protein [Acidimicrobiales bacterium]|nr:DUF6049 family protein [Acidimicrobiales bacterium]